MNELLSSNAFDAMAIYQNEAEVEEDEMNQSKLEEKSTVQKLNVTW